jgi:hypothetical protein
MVAKPSQGPIDADELDELDEPEEEDDADFLDAMVKCERGSRTVRRLHDKGFLRYGLAGDSLRGWACAK